MRQGAHDRYEPMAIIVEQIRNGASMAAAARKAGINPRTARNWYAWGRDAHDETSEYHQFYMKVERAWGDYEMVHISNINDQSHRDWRASAWLLEKRFPEEYGKKQTEKESVEYTPSVTNMLERINDDIESRGIESSEEDE